MAHNHNHNHNHDHGHGECIHSSAPKNFNIAFFIAISLNLIYTIIQVIFAYIANSSSLLADAGHNLSDVLSLIFAWIGNMMLTKPATKRFSYGYKKTTVLTALLNALILFTASGLIAAEAISKFFHPHPVGAMDVIIVAAIGIVVNFGSALLFIRGKNDLNIKAAFLHLAFDALVSLGVVIAGIIMYFTHWYLLDPIVSLVITVVIIVGTWGLLKDSLFMALDAVPRNIKLKDVEAHLLAFSGVEAIHDLHIWSLSTRDTALSTHLIIPGGCDDKSLHELSSSLKHEFNINHTTIQVENETDGNPCEHLERC